MRPARIPLACLALAAALAAAAGCGDSLGLPDAVSANRVDTVRLYALDGTPLELASAYDIETRLTVRTDRSSRFDFAFTVDSTGQAVFLPTGAIGMARGPGFLAATQSFDSITIAPTGPYQDSTAVAADSGGVWIVRSRAVGCFGATVFYYAKLRVLAVIDSVRAVEFEILANVNCGYRGLEPGLPSR